MKQNGVMVYVLPMDGVQGGEHIHVLPPGHPSQGDLIYTL